jgi:hypothetical protein
MAATATLPPNLTLKLEELAAHVRRLRRLRGLSVLLLTVALGTALAVGVDLLFDLSGPVRALLLLGWLAACGTVAWFGLLRPARNEVDIRDLAATIEDQYPRLHERLTTSIELAEAADDYHGSRNLVQLLIRETDLKTRALDFLQVAPRHNTEWIAVAAGIVFLLTFAVPALFLADRYLELGSRFVFPWTNGTAFLPYSVALTPGDCYAAKGRPLTVTAQFVAKRDGVKLPDACTLVLQPAGGKALRLRMNPGDGPSTFAFPIDAVQGDYRYHVETGRSASEVHAITAVEPVELAAGAPTLTVTPPAYARAGREAQSTQGLADLSALQYSTVTFDGKLSRPAAAVRLLWTPHRPAARVPGGNQQLETSSKSIDLAGNRQSFRLDLPATQTGRYQLVLEAEHGITTELPAQTLTVTPDQPPTFQKVAGAHEQPGAVAVSETIPLDLAVTDDFGVAKAEFEYRINDGPEQREAIALTGLGTTAASGRHTFPLAGKVKDGDTLSYRVRVEDNRSVPEAGLGPNVAYYPRDGRWCILHVTAKAEPLREQEVASQRDDIEQRLKELVDELSREARKTYELRQEMAKNPTAQLGQEQKIEDLKDEAAKATRRLAELAKDVAPLSGLQDFAAKMQAVASGELQRAGESLKQAGESVNQPRSDALGIAERELAAARDKLEAMRKENPELAKTRLDEAKLESLAEKERELAAKAAEAKTPDQREQVQQQQEEVAKDLEKLTEQSEALKKALEAAQAEQAQKLADQARAMAQAERDLDKSKQDADRKQQAGKLADLAQAQEKLAEQTAKLAKDSRAAALAAQTPPLNPAEAKQAAEAMKQGDADAALAQQEQTARDLDKLAAGLRKAIDLAADPREAAQQLARMQDANRQRLQGPNADADAAQRDQEAIRDAAGRLPIPEKNAAAQAERRDALAKAAQAAEALKNGDAKSADQKMSQARQALDRVAEALPDVAQRQQQAREEVARLRRQQEEVARQAEKAVQAAGKGDAAKRPLAERLAEPARQQAAIAERIGQLDAPGQEARKDRVQDAAARALDDLTAARAQDVAASQAEAKRALDRLDEALAGKKPADEKAAELARKQQELAAEADKQWRAKKPDAQKDADLQKRQQQIAKEAKELVAPDAPVRQAEAAKATAQAATALREEPNSPATAGKAQEAARKLEQLAAQLQGQESDADRAERLARQQEAAAAAAEARKADPDARQRLQQEAEEAKQIRAGDQAAAEKQQVQDALDKAAQKATGTPAEQAKAQRQAAQALRDLADRMAGRTDDAAKAAQIAKEQRQLADQAPKLPSTPAATKQTAEQEADLAQRLDAVKPTPAAAAAKQETQGAMGMARQALEQGKAPPEAKPQLADAADAAERFAKLMSQKTDETAQADTPPADAAASAEELAKKQQDLAQQTGEAGQKDGDVKQQALDQAAAAQKQLSRQAASLPSKSAPQATQQAREEMAKAEQALAQKNAGEAQQHQEQAAKALEQAARQQAAKQDAAKPAEGQPASGTPQAGQAQQAEDLAKQQRSLQDQVRAAAGRPGTDQPKGADQQKLEQQARELAKALDELSEQMPNPSARRAAREAAQSGQEAQRAMTQAEQAATPTQAGQARQQAAQALDEAARQASQAAEGGAPGEAGQPKPASESGQSLRQAKQQMAQAQGQLGEGQPKEAGQSMQQAAQSMQQAAQKMSSPGQPSDAPQQPNAQQPATAGAPPQGAPDTRKFAKDLEKYAGKPWGELPGELRTKIVQEMKSQYGEDYARVIKLYFEQIADRK